VIEVDVAGRCGIACGDGAAQAIMTNAAATISKPVAPVSHVLVARSMLTTAVIPLRPDSRYHPRTLHTVVTR